MLTGELLQALAQRCRQPHLDPFAAVTGAQWARVVQGQLQRAWVHTQPLAPILQLALTLAGLHPAALPDRVVAVLDRQGRQRRNLACKVSSVEAQPLLDHHLHGSGIGNDMVLYQHQHMLTGTAAQQQAAQQLALVQLEGLACPLADKGIQLGIRTVPRLLFDADLRLRVDLREHLAVVLDEAGTQALVTRHQGIQAGLQRCAVQLAIEAQGSTDVIGRAKRVQAPEEPQAFLGIGQGHGLERVAHHGNGELRQVHALGLEPFEEHSALLHGQPNEPLY